MTPQEIDVVVRVAGATLLLAAAIVLSGQDARRDRLFFLPLALCLCGFLAGNTPDAALRLSGLAGHAAYVLSGFGAVFLWWFCLAVFDRTFRPEGLVLVAGLGWIAIAAADRGLFGKGTARAGGTACRGGLTCVGCSICSQNGSRLGLGAAGCCVQGSSAGVHRQASGAGKRQTGQTGI